MRLWSVILVGALALAGTPSVASNGDTWAGYLDYAYIYSSATPEALSERLEDYAAEAGSTLDDYRIENLTGSDLSEREQRRRAIAHLLKYLSSGDTRALRSSVRDIRAFQKRLDRHETRYWYYYILSHDALERGDAALFVDRVFKLWRTVVLELEAPYETLRSHSLEGAANSGFVASLPYLYENTARLVLIRTQEQGLNHGLDPLAAIVRTLDDERIGSHPDVIPLDASSRGYIARIRARLEGPESDGGSLSFTLALFEAARHHERARSLLATEGVSDAAVESIHLTTGAYQRALGRAETLQGQAAVYTRVLRQLGEVHAAKLRLGSRTDVEIPFSIDQAARIYSALAADLNGDWAQHGYAELDRNAYLQALHGLWAEIQEASLNLAAYHLTHGQDATPQGAAQRRQAAKLYTDYLALFERYASAEQREGIPNSAYFAAYEAAKGIGDSILLSAGEEPDQGPVRLASQRYQSAIELFPFDWQLWLSLASAIELQGKQGDYLSLVRPLASDLSSSRSVNDWIEGSRENASQLEAVRRALTDDIALLYLGFGDASRIAELEESLADLRDKRARVFEELAQLAQQRDALLAQRRDELSNPAAPSETSDLLTVSSQSPKPELSTPIADLNAKIASVQQTRDRLDRQIQARDRALPLLRNALETEDLTDALRSRRDHPVHNLLRRLYHEES